MRGGQWNFTHASRKIFRENLLWILHIAAKEQFIINSTVCNLLTASRALSAFPVDYALNSGREVERFGNLADCRPSFPFSKKYLRIPLYTQRRFIQINISIQTLLENVLSHVKYSELKLDVSFSFELYDTRETHYNCNCNSSKKKLWL